MGSSIENVNAKIRRSKAHLVDLECELEKLKKSGTYELVTVKRKTNSEESEIVLRIHKGLSSDISLICGDLVHNLRSALDYLAEGLVKAGGGIVTKDIAFPIMSKSDKPTPEKYKELVECKIKGCSKPVLEICLNLEPYIGGKDELLWCLSFLDNVDKHRVLITALASFEKLNVDFGLMMSDTFGKDLPSMKVGLVPKEQFPLSDGYVLYRGPTKDVHHTEPQVVIALGEPAQLAGKDIHESMMKLMNAVDLVAAKLKEHI